MLLRELNADAAGFVLPIFRSASEDVTPTPRGEKEFRIEFNNADWAWNFNKILKLRSLPLSSALWPGGLPNLTEYIMYVFSQVI